MWGALHGLKLLFDTEMLNEEPWGWNVCCLQWVVSGINVFTESGLVTRVCVIRKLRLDFICHLFPTVSDPDLLTWINQHSLPVSDRQNMLAQRMAVVNIVWVGQPLNSFSETQVSFLSPERMTARDRWGGRWWLKSMVLIQRPGVPLCCPLSLWGCH